MADQNWDDDTEYRQAKGRAWLMVAISSCCSLLVLALMALAAFGVSLFVAVVEALSG
ncbi:hypothetical protein ACIPSA_31605 [Streptomyces sp. NPDC086549]|uniref:hypothetical protein n=1 Tax=Streptomyces sp. NPDC086549 TaxID=3365752 RepID=UPI003801CDFC